MRRDSNLLAVFGGLIVALFILIAVVACNDGSPSGGGYYPHDTSHGYYDSHHHYHYYPKYGSGHRSVVKPAPRPNKAPAAPSYRSGSKRR